MRLVAKLPPRFFTIIIFWFTAKMFAQEFRESGMFGGLGDFSTRGTISTLYQLVCNFSRRNKREQFQELHVFHGFKFPFFMPVLLWD